MRFYVIELGIEGDHIMNFAVMDRATKNSEGRDSVYACFCFKEHAQWFCDLMNTWTQPSPSGPKA